MAGDGLVDGAVGRHDGRVVFPRCTNQVGHDLLALPVEIRGTQLRDAVTEAIDTDVEALTTPLDETVRVEDDEVVLLQPFRSRVVSNRSIDPHDRSVWASEELCGDAANEEWRRVLTEAFAPALQEYGFAALSRPAAVSLVMTMAQGYMLERLSDIEEGHEALLSEIEAWMKSRTGQARSARPKKGRPT